MEGMLIQPQHFQQLGRWIEHSLETRVAGVRGHGWGVREIEIDRELLALGQFRLSRLLAVLADGTVIDAPDVTPLPPARAIDKTSQALILHVATPARAGDVRDVAETSADWQRHAPTSQAVRDTTATNRPPRDLTVGQLSLRFVTAEEVRDALVLLPVARIREVEASGAIRLDPGFIPPLLDVHASDAMVAIVNEVRGLLKSRADALAMRTDPSRGSADSAGLVDILTLAMANGHEAVFEHFAATTGLHPEVIWTQMLRLAGELSTFTQSRRRPDLPAYRHDDLQSVLLPLMQFLRQALSVVIERNAISLPLQERGYGVSTATIADRTLLQGSRFILVVTASVPAEQVRVQFPNQVKIGSVEQIRDLVNLQLPGIPIRALSVAPREIPLLQNATYFELDQSHELWRPLVRSAAFAFHVSGDYSDLHLEFWAVRGKSV
jgi:type VI secretion system protein ImpJ